jgi:hypothetical protein
MPVSGGLHIDIILSMSTLNAKYAEIAGWKRK